jgi:hypothetical protein
VDCCAARRCRALRSRATEALKAFDGWVPFSRILGADGISRASSVLTTHDTETRAAESFGPLIGAVSVPGYLVAASQRLRRSVIDGLSRLRHQASSAQLWGVWPQSTTLPVGFVEGAAAAR